MTADHLVGIEQFEADLWKVADNLRANSNLASNEYFMPILGLIFLRHATNRYHAAMAAIEEGKAAGRMPDRPLVEADFMRRRALMLPEPARYDVLLERRKDGNLGAAVTAAMEAVEDHFPPLAGQLPKDYERFEDDVLEEMMRTFDSEALRTASGDVFGRIYEYFLAEFSKQGAHDNGEFFTPPSIVQTIVNVIEPDHGVVLDPACGSGGMFVQSSHFIEDAGEDAMKRVTFYGHEKNELISARTTASADCGAFTAAEPLAAFAPKSRTAPPPGTRVATVRRTTTPPSTRRGKACMTWRSAAET